MAWLLLSQTSGRQSLVGGKKQSFEQNMLHNASCVQGKLSVLGEAQCFVWYVGLRLVGRTLPVCYELRQYLLALNLYQPGGDQRFYMSLNRVMRKVTLSSP